MEKVSIIIPVYNGEHFLNKCVDSVLNQNYKNVEFSLMTVQQIEAELYAMSMKENIRTLK